MWLGWLVALIVLGIFITRTNWYKGVIGEKRAGRVLKKVACAVGGLEMHDFMFEDARSSSQIDNMLVTKRALYVIEMKNYRGMIFGSQENRQWTLTIKHINKRRGKRGKTFKKASIAKRQFYSPIKQNQTHINKIKSLSTIASSLPVYNIVVFGNKATLKITGNGASEVVNLRRLRPTIEARERSLNKEMTLEEQIEVVDTLHALNITDKKARRAHVKRLKKRYEG